MALEYSPKLVTNGLITYYDPKDPYGYSGDVLYDLSGNGYDGTMVNGSAISEGTVRNSDRYDYLRAGNYDFTSLTNYTVELFYKRTGINNSGTGGDGLPTYYQGVFNYYWQQYIYVGTGSDANSLNLDIFGITTTLQLNQWVHIVGINGPGGIRAYINGTLLGSLGGLLLSSLASFACDLIQLLLKCHGPHQCMEYKFQAQCEHHDRSSYLSWLQLHLVGHQLAWLNPLQTTNVQIAEAAPRGDR